MKHLILISLLAATAGQAFPQEYLDAIARNSCSCLKEIPDTLDTEQFNMKLGFCILEASAPYKKQLKKNQNINFDNIEVEGEKLGRLIGVRMTTVCPDVLTKVTHNVKPKSVREPMVASGTVIKIENETFVIFSLKDDTGKITKYHWLSFVESDLDLANSYSGMVGKSIRISYETKEFFDPKLLEYRQFSVIKKIIAED